MPSDPSADPNPPKKETSRYTNPFDAPIPSPPPPGSKSGAVFPPALDSAPPLSAGHSQNRDGFFRNPRNRWLITGISLSALALALVIFLLGAKRMLRGSGRGLPTTSVEVVTHNLIPVEGIETVPGWALHLQPQYAVQPYPSHHRLRLIPDHPALGSEFLHRTTYRITSFDATGAEVASGLAFSISDRHLVTCLHIVSQSAFAVAVPIAGPIERRIILTDCAGYSRIHDLAVLSCPLNERTSDALALESMSFPAKGEKVYTLSPANGSHPDFVEGLLNGYTQHEDAGTVLKFTAPLPAGSPGGPLLNGRGAIIGVITQPASREGDGVNTAVGVSGLWAILKKSPATIPLKSLQR